jgi:hypothetical protein
MSYEIVRFYFDDNHPDHKRVIKRGLTREEAQAHCQRDDTREEGPDGHTIWFDSFTQSEED